MISSPGSSTMDSLEGAVPAPQKLLFSVWVGITDFHFQQIPS